MSDEINFLVSMDKKLFSIAAMWLLFGSAYAMLILVLVYKMAYLSAFGINGAHYVSFSELFADMVEPWVLVISTMLITAYILIWYQNLGIIARPFEKIRNSKWAEKEREAKKKQREKRAQLQEKGHVLLYEFFSAVIILGIVFWGIMKQHEEGAEMGMSSAIVGMRIPIIIYAGLNIGAKFLAHIIGTSDIPVKSDQKVLRTVVELTVPFFIYAVGLFYYNGFCAGEDCKSSKQVAFEVKAVDGSSYTNDAYVFVAQSNSEILLYDRNTCKIIILNSHSITQLQFENNPVLKSSLLREWMERLIKK